MNIDRSKIDDPYSRKDIGESECTDFEKTAENIDALVCPFCGSEAAARIDIVWLTPAVSIYCTGCGITTQRGFTGLHANGKKYSLSDRLIQAAEKWNKRGGASK